MPFWTLCVLFSTQSVATCITTLERGNDNRNYRAALRVACLSGCSASSWRRRASRPALPRRSAGTIIATIVRRSASYAFLDALRPLRDAERRDLHYHAGACGTRYQLSGYSRLGCNAERWEREASLAQSLRLFVQINAQPQPGQRRQRREQEDRDKAKACGNRACQWAGDAQ